MTRTVLFIMNDDPLIGRVFGPYEVVQKMAQGGMGVVYQARHQTLNRKVAIKFLTPQLHANPEYVRRFLREARATAHLNHPNIISVYDAVVSEEGCYLVMEYVNGNDLDRLMQKGERFDELRAVRLVRKAASALAYVHRQGIVHRDIKPQNLILTPEEEIKVGDLGVASWIEQADDPSQVSGLNLASPVYLSPEQARGDSRIDHRTDIYSLGATFYHMVTGNPPFLGSTSTEFISKHVYEPLAWPQLAHPSLSYALSSILSKMMAKDPAERYQSMDELVGALDELEKSLAEKTSVVSASRDLEAVSKQTLAVLKNRLQGKTDFPSLAAAFNLVGKLTSMNEEISMEEVAQAILGDFSLANKILKLVNSAYYGGHGRDITTISRAIDVLGLRQVRDAAVSLMLFENFQSNPMAGEVKSASIDNFLSGMIARNLGVKIGLQNKEEAFVCAMFHNLGKLLATFYLPEMNGRIRELAACEGCDEEQTSHRVLGIPYSNLGAIVAKEWNFPGQIITSMKKLTARPLPQPETELDRLHAVVCFSNELARLIRHARMTPEEMEKAFKEILWGFENCFSLTTENVSEIVGTSLQDLSSYASALGLEVEVGSGQDAGPRSNA